MANRRERRGRETDGGGPATRSVMHALELAERTNATVIALYAADTEGSQSRR